MHVPTVKNPMCTSFKEYEEVPEITPLDLSEDNVTSLASKLSGAAGALGAVETELRNWLLCFRCASEEFRVVVSDMYN